MQQLLFVFFCGGGGGVTLCEHARWRLPGGPVLLQLLQCVCVRRLGDKGAAMLLVFVVSVGCEC